MNAAGAIKSLVSCSSLNFNIRRGADVLRSTSPNAIHKLASSVHDSKVMTTEKKHSCGEMSRQVGDEVGYMEAAHPCFRRRLKLQTWQKHHILLADSKL